MASNPVRTLTGTPIADDFDSPDGTPIVVDMTVGAERVFMMNDSGTIVEIANRNAGAGNADTLDGLDSAAFAEIANTEIITGAWTFNTSVSCGAGVTVDGVDLSAHAAATAVSAHTAGVGTHTHQSAGAQGGTLDHGLALTGLTDDDHTQYYLANGTRALNGPLNHAGSTVGFYGTTPVVQAAASANLTDNSGGTANDTVQALTNPADTPASADALRDDLVANLIPELRNNFADLAAKVNKALTVLRNSGLMAT